MTEQERTDGMNDAELGQAILQAEVEHESTNFIAIEAAVGECARRLVTAELAARALPDEDALVEAVARRICQSKSFEGVNCCQWPANRGRTKCPVKDGGYDDAAHAALSAIRPHIAALQARVEAAEAEVGRPQQAPENSAHEPGMGWKISEEAVRKIEALVYQNTQNAADIQSVVLASLPPTTRAALAAKS